MHLDLSFILVMILAWVILRRTIYILLGQEGYKGFETIFWIKKHGHILFQITIALFSKRLTLKQYSMPPNTCHVFIFHFLIVLSFA